MTSSPSSSVDARVDALYALPLDEFVAGRKRLADELKREGAAAEAKAFLALAKPTLSAWLTNQIVRRAPDLVRELLAATDAVAAAQRKHPGAGGAAPDFPAAVAAQRHAVGELARRARAIAAELGVGGSATDALARVENNFRWGAIPGPDREALARGRLIRDVAAPGFGGFGEGATGDEVPLPAPRSARPSGSSTAAVEPENDTGVERTHPRTEAHHQAESDRARARAAAEAEREHRRLVARHEAALHDAQAETARARRELARAERDRTAADERVASAEAALASVREARDAAEEHRRAAAETLAAHEAAEATLRRTGPPAPVPPGGPFRIISGR
jgi:hypothetical protein